MLVCVSSSLSLYLILSILSFCALYLAVFLHLCVSIRPHFFLLFGVSLSIYIYIYIYFFLAFLQSLFLSYLSFSSFPLSIYIYAMKLLTGPSLGVFKVINWAKSKLLTGPRSFSHYKNRGFRRLLFAQLSLCVFCSQLSGNFLKIAFFKKGCKNWVFQFSAF